MIDQFIKFIIRPPRAEYNPDHYLWETEFTLGGRKFRREDVELRNGRGHLLKCSHYVPSLIPENVPLPCVIYCHGNSGCRADANEAAVVLLPSNITLFTLDFSGSGLSDGQYVSLGWHEKDDLKVVVSYLRNKKDVSCIGLWGRSMGAVTSLLYGADDPSIAGMVLDSAFSNLFDLMMELVDVYKIRLPKFTVKIGVQYMRHVIQRKAKFDIMNLNCAKVAPKTFIPALFGHATEDALVRPHHLDIIFNSYAGDKNVIKFEGDHNSARPQFYYDSVSIFFYHVLHPPQILLPEQNKLEKYHNFGGLKIDAGMKERFLYEIIAGLRMVEILAHLLLLCWTLLTGYPTDPIERTDQWKLAVIRSKSISELFSDTGAFALRANDRGNMVTEMDGNDDSDDLQSQDKENEPSEECCSYSSSNHESWGRCSSLGGVSDEGPSSADCPRSTSSRHQAVLKVLATPLRKFHGKSECQPVKQKESSTSKKPKRDKFEKWEVFSQRLISRIFKRVNVKRQQSRRES